MAATARHFDTLGAAEELEAVGLTHDQAKAISLVVDRSRDSGKFTTEIAAVRDEIAAVRDEMAAMRSDIAVLKAQVRYIFWVLGIQSAVLVAIALKVFQ